MARKTIEASEKSTPASLADKQRNTKINELKEKIDDPESVRELNKLLLQIHSDSGARAKELSIKKVTSSTIRNWDSICELEEKTFKEIIDIGKNTKVERPKENPKKRPTREGFTVSHMIRFGELSKNYKGKKYHKAICSFARIAARGGWDEKQIKLYDRYGVRELKDVAYVDLLESIRNMYVRLVGYDHENDIKSPVTNGAIATKRSKKDSTVLFRKIDGKDLLDDGERTIVVNEVRQLFRNLEARLGS